MKNNKLKANLILLLAAAIWGFAFVAQRVGAKYLGAFSFNGVRFALGGISLLPLLFIGRKAPVAQTEGKYSTKGTVLAGMLAGCFLFFASSFQQLGLSETTAGKAAFITGLYIVLVPVFGIFLKHNIRMNTWIGAVAAIAGLYILSVTDNFTMSKGDAFELAGAALWAVHILLIDSFAKKVDVLKLSFVQFVTCSILSLSTALVFEIITVKALSQALIPLLYGGILSVGVAYTLQAVGQRYAKPSHAAIVLSLEAVFASIGGFIFLNENLGLRGYAGCALMLAGMLFSQLQLPKSEQV